MRCGSAQLIFCQCERRRSRTQRMLECQAPWHSNNITRFANGSITLSLELMIRRPFGHLRCPLAPQRRAKRSPCKDHPLCATRLLSVVQTPTHRQARSENRQSPVRSVSKLTQSFWFKQTDLSRPLHLFATCRVVPAFHHSFSCH